MRPRFPTFSQAGLDCGTAGIAGNYSGAVLTVAGHDHLVAAIGAGADDAVFDSLGTGVAVLTRVARGTESVDPSLVKDLNAAGFNVGLGLETDHVVALCGLGTGNRLLGLFAIPPTDQAGTLGAAFLPGLAAGVYGTPTEFPSLRTIAR